MISREKLELPMFIKLSISDPWWCFKPKDLKVFVRDAYEGAKTYHTPRDAKK